MKAAASSRDWCRINGEIALKALLSIRNTHVFIRMTLIKNMRSLIWSEGNLDFRVFDLFHLVVRYFISMGAR